MSSWILEKKGKNTWLITADIEYTGICFKEFAWVKYPKSFTEYAFPITNDTILAYRDSIIFAKATGKPKLKSCLNDSLSNAILYLNGEAMA